MSTASTNTTASRETLDERGPAAKTRTGGNQWVADDGRLLDVEDLHVEFRTRDGVAQAINGVNFTLDEGETLAVLGESGSGKSVTAQAIMGIIDTPPGHITGGDPALVRELAGIADSALATMTVAPEAEDADAVLEALAETGAVPSLGHTDGSSAQMTRAVALSRDALRRARGRSPLPTATHLFNGMRPVHHRDPGPALAALDAAARGELVVELIADGVHLDARTVAHVFSIAAEDRVALVTDAMSAAGAGDGDYRLGPLPVRVTDGVARITTTGAIAGSTLTLDRAVSFAVERAGVSLEAALRAATQVPAARLGRDDIGALRPGALADLVALGPGADLRLVVARGRELPTPRPAAARP